ncbi:hypothetical protein OUZ56_026300 [Daphnia magna]|uniref:Uncharacterized protein n=1 Tax=Daphnia magna TaxID=35525 RepID=A0ABQ9ZLT0_9CRUS|nr:hypothetical protein OUZ56_026300 [Daphnia magna]
MFGHDSDIRRLKCAIWMKTIHVAKLLYFMIYMLAWSLGLGPDYTPNYPKNGRLAATRNWPKFFKMAWHISFGVVPLRSFHLMVQHLFGFYLNGGAKLDRDGVRLDTASFPHKET